MAAAKPALLDRFAHGRCAWGPAPTRLVAFAPVGGLALPVGPA